MLTLAIVSLVAYLLGSIPTGYWLGKLLKGIDIRKEGSGSTGATNVLRCLGKGPALFVLIIDILKGVIPVYIASFICQQALGQTNYFSEFLQKNSIYISYQETNVLDNILYKDYYLAPIAAIISLIGHSKSIFLNFTGGKSAATGLGTIFALNFYAGLCTFILFVSTIFIGRIVSIASILAGLSSALFMYYFSQQTSYTLYCLVGGIYVLVRHRSNIVRIIKGTEPKIGQKLKEKENSSVLSVCLFLCFVQFFYCFETHAKTSTATNIQTNKQKTAPLTAEEQTNIQVYKIDSSAVVNITTLASPEELIWGMAPPPGTGSGSIISPDGYILTNNHVLNGARMVKVTVFDGTSFPAQVIGTDPDNDLAVVKIEAKNRKLSVIKFGDSSKLEVGRRVFTIGNPFGLDLTMTSGIISSVGRSLRTENNRVIKGVIQTDAAINPGNSGGPLLDTQGNMIGVTTAIYSKVQQSSGIGFAIPINIVKKIVPSLISHGAILRPDLGILTVRQSELGLLVMSTDPKGPAALAGIRGPSIKIYQAGGFNFKEIDNSQADIITGIDSQHVSSVDDLLSYVETKKPGQVVTLNVLRQGHLTKIPVKLVEGR